MLNRKILVSKPWELEFVKDSFVETIEGLHDVIIKNLYSHISTGTELACISGKESWFQIPGTPGYTSVGRIEQKGESVAHNIGDIVYTMGPHSERFKIDSTDRWHGICVPVPDAVPPDIAAFTHMAGIAMTSLRVSHIELGDTVLVTGLGVIGNLAAQLAQLQGANVIAVDRIDARLDAATRCGIATLVNAEKQDVKSEVEKLTNGKGVEAFIDATGVSKVVESYLDTVAFQGQVILLGSPRQPYQTDLTQTLQAMHLLPHSLKMSGALEFIFPTHENEFVKHSIERNSKIILDLMAKERLSINPFYTHKLYPSQAEQAYKGLRDEPEKYMGVVFDWTRV
jgi:2-desacetyl-2-hydroxyethyl bacteriochlorophyllide A dehydrogenase